MLSANFGRPLPNSKLSPLKERRKSLPSESCDISIEWAAETKRRSSAGGCRDERCGPKYSTGEGHLLPPLSVANRAVYQQIPQVIHIPLSRPNLDAMGSGVFHPQTRGFLLFHGRLAAVLFPSFRIKRLRDGNYNRRAADAGLSTGNLQEKFFRRCCPQSDTGFTQVYSQTVDNWAFARIAARAVRRTDGVCEAFDTV